MAGGKLKIITTLHGTDITLVGIDVSYREIVKFSIENSDGVTAVSNYLRDVTYQEFKIDKEIEVIYNFVNPDKFTRADNIRRRRRFAEDDEKIVVHVSNFRPVKRIPDLVNIFAEIVKEVPAKLVLVGDGPDRALATQMLYDMGLRDKAVFTLHNFPVQCVLSIADIFLLPSQTESFGLAALEAMSCETPVVASRTGGLPEVIEHGKSRLLAEVGDISRMAYYAIQVLKDDSLRQYLGKEARKRVISNFPTDMLVSQYERYYEEVLGR